MQERRPDPFIGDAAAQIDDAIETVIGDQGDHLVARKINGRLSKLNVTSAICPLQIIAAIKGQTDFLWGTMRSVPEAVL